MRASTDHIATSHVGSLPRPDGLIAAHRAHEAGEPVDAGAFQQTLRDAVAEVVRHQRARISAARQPPPPEDRQQQRDEHHARAGHEPRL